MRNFDAMINSRIFQVGEFLFKLLAINLLILVTSLPFVTLYVALVAGYKQILFYQEKREASIIKTYFTFFKEDFLKNMMYGIAFSVLLVVLIFNIRFYYLSLANHPLYAVGLYLSVILLVVYLIFLIHMPLIQVYTTVRPLKQRVKLALFMSIRNLFLSLLLLFFIGLSILIFRYIPPLFILYGVSVPIYFTIKLSKQAYHKLSSNEVI